MAEKRVRREPEVARALILDTAERLMMDEGYAAVTTRRVSRDAGVNVALVHYYFPTTDDLFLALHRRLADFQVENLKALVEKDDPLQAMWKFESGWLLAPLAIEFVALSNHRKAIKDEVLRRAEEVRQIQMAAIMKQVQGSQVDARCMSTLMVGVARALMNEEALGMTAGHAEVREFMDWLFANLVPVGLLRHNSQPGPPDRSDEMPTAPPRRAT